MITDELFDELCQNEKKREEYIQKYKQFFEHIKLTKSKITELCKDKKKRRKYLKKLKEKYNL